MGTCIDLLYMYMMYMEFIQIERTLINLTNSHVLFSDACCRWSAEACIKGHLQIVKILLEASWNGSLGFLVAGCRCFDVFFLFKGVEHPTYECSSWIRMAIHGCTILSHVISNAKGFNVRIHLQLDDLWGTLTHGNPPIPGQSQYGGSGLVDREDAVARLKPWDFPREISCFSKEHGTG